MWIRSHEGRSGSPFTAPWLLCPHQTLSSLHPGSLTFKNSNNCPGLHPCNRMCRKSYLPPKQRPSVSPMWSICFCFQSIFRNTQGTFKKKKKPSFNPAFHKYPAGSLNRKCQHGVRNRALRCSEGLFSSWTRLVVYRLNNIPACRYPGCLP